jgi:hypothetical protein
MKRQPAIYKGMKSLAGAIGTLTLIMLALTPNVSTADPTDVMLTGHPSRYGMRIVKAREENGEITVETTGYRYVISPHFLRAYQKLYTVNQPGERAVVCLAFFGDPLSNLRLVDATEDYAIVASDEIWLGFRGDSLVLMHCYADSFVYSYNSLIDAPWNKGAQSSRFFRDNYGGSLHSKDPNKPGSIAATAIDDKSFRITLTNGKGVIFATFPPKRFPFEKLYSPGARPHAVVAHAPAHLTDYENRFASLAEKGVGIIGVASGTTSTGFIYDTTGSERPDNACWPVYIEDKGYWGYRYADPERMRSFIQSAHANGYKVIAYLHCCNFGRKQDINETLRFLTDFKEAHQLDGFYLDGALHDISFLRNYEFILAMRELVGNDGVIIHHDSVNLWGGNSSGVDFVPANAYVDHTHRGETGDLANAIDGPNDPYMRYYVCQFGASQALSSFVMPGLPSMVDGQIVKFIVSKITRSQAMKIFSYLHGAPVISAYAKWRRYYYPEWRELQNLYLNGQVGPRDFRYDVDWPVSNEGWEDTDGDGLCDFEEIDMYGTNPDDADTDNDGRPDYWDIFNEQDADTDGLPDFWELHYGLDPDNPADRNDDPDEDGRTNLEELIANSNPVGAGRAETYTLRITARNGFVIKDLAKAQYASNARVTLTAVAGDGYKFDRWTGDFTGMRNPATIIMNSSKEINALLIKDNPDLTPPPARSLHVDTASPSDPVPDDPSVSDPLEDGSSAHPFDCIQKAIDNARSGDRIYVSQGTYIEHIDFQGKAIRLEPEEDETVVIDGENNGPIIVFDSGERADSILSGFTLKNGGNSPNGIGGAIYCRDSSPTIEYNVITECGSGCSKGGALACINSAAVLTGNVMTHNHATDQGGAVYGESSEIVFSNNLVTNNRCREGAAFFFGQGTSAILNNNTIADNTASIGSAVYGGEDTATAINNSIIWENGGQDQVYCVKNASINVQYSCLEGGWEGTGNIGAGPEDNPLFMEGTYGSHYLSQPATGDQNQISLGLSPCVNAGDPDAKPFGETTRTDGMTDTERLDIGYHYPIPPLFEILHYYSVIQHGKLSEFRLNLDERKVEPRYPGVQRLEFEMSDSMDPSTVTVDNISVTGAVNGSYPDEHITLSLKNSVNGPATIVVVDFDPALPDEDCWRINLRGMKAWGRAPADPVVFVKTLAGDINRDERVTCGDIAPIKIYFQTFIVNDTFLYDFNCDGLITSSDSSMIKPFFMHQSPDCEYGKRKNSKEPKTKMLLR